MSVTIDEIAKKANLAKSTVSKALNRYDDVSQETIEKVSKIAMELGYSPKLSFLNSYGISPTKSDSYKKTRTGIIDLILYRQSFHVRRNEYFLTLIENLHMLAAKEDLLLLESFPQNEQDFDKLLLAGKSDGCILLSNIQAIESQLLYKMKAASTKRPIIFLSNYNKDYELQFHTVRADNVEAGYQAARYALTQGCDPVCFIHQFPMLAIANDRLEGYKKAMKEAGKPATVIDYPLPPKGAGETLLVRNLAAPTDRLTGYVGDGDTSILRFGGRLKAEGVYDPKTMILVGIDGRPSLTPDDVRNATFQLDLESMASLVLHVLSKAVDYKAMPIQRLLVGGRMVEKGKETEEEILIDQKYPQEV